MTDDIEARAHELVMEWRYGGTPIDDRLERLIAIALREMREECAKAAEYYEPDQKHRGVVYASQSIRRLGEKHGG